MQHRLETRHLKTAWKVCLFANINPYIPFLALCWETKGCRIKAHPTRHGHTRSQARKNAKGRASNIKRGVHSPRLWKYTSDLPVCEKWNLQLLTVRKDSKQSVTHKLSLTVSNQANVNDVKFACLAYTNKLTCSATIAFYGKQWTFRKQQQ